MKLRSPGIKGRGAVKSKDSPTTIPGYRNENGQVVIASTGAASTRRSGQKIYRIRCEHCGHEYGANGLEIHERLCPSHQGGLPGEPLPAPMPTLFS